MRPLKTFGVLVPVRVAPPRPFARTPPRAPPLRSPPAAVAGIPAERGWPCLWEAERLRHRHRQPNQPHPGHGGNVPGRRALLGDCIRGGSTIPASRPRCSQRSGPRAAQLRRICGRPGGPRGVREARLLRGIDEQGDGRLGLGRGGPPRSAVRARPGSKLDRGCGGAACVLAAVVTHAVLCRSGSGEPGPRSVALTARFVCNQKSVREGGFCFSFPKT